METIVMIIAAMGALVANMILGLALVGVVEIVHYALKKCGKKSLDRENPHQQKRRETSIWNLKNAGKGHYDMGQATRDALDVIIEASDEEEAKAKAGALLGEKYTIVEGDERRPEYVLIKQSGHECNNVCKWGKKSVRNATTTCQPQGDRRGAASNRTERKYMLRDYQILALTQIRSAYQIQRKKSVCLQLQTGGGKTIIACTYAMEQPKDQQAIFLVHREELVEQTVRNLVTCDRKIAGNLGVINARRAGRIWAKLQVAMAQTLSRRLDKLPWLNPSLIIVDECHHVRAETWEKILNKWPDAKLLGLTATPARLDGKGLEKWFEHLVIGPSYHELVQKQALAPIKMFSVPEGIDLRGCKTMAGDYSKHDVDQRITKGVIANATQNTLRFCQNLQFIHYAFNIRHSQEYAAKMREHGLSVEHIDGNLNAQTRRDIIDRYRRGVTQGISNCQLINEGFDVPETQAVILGMRTMSTTLFRQACGRASRPKKDHQPGLIIDLAGNYELHGRPDEEIQWSLQEGIVDKAKKKPAPYSICSNCGYIKPRNQRECEACGYIPETPLPQEVNVNLQEVQVQTTLNFGQQIKEPKLPVKTLREIGRMVESSLGNEDHLNKIIRKYGFHPSKKDYWKTMWGAIWAKRLKELYGTKDLPNPTIDDIYIR